MNPQPPLDPAALVRLKELKAAATPGPWPNWQILFEACRNNPKLTSLIVAAVNNLDALLSAAEEVVRLRELLHRVPLQDLRYDGLKDDIRAALSPHEGSAG